MKKANNGKYWTSEFWTEKHVISESQYLEYDNWFYKNLFDNNKQELSLKKFEREVELYKKNLVGEKLIELLIYSSGIEFQIKPSDLDEIIRDAIVENNYSKDAIWFTAYKSHTYNYDLGEMGLYSFERGDDKTINGALYPIFNKIMNADTGQTLETNYGLFSGIIGAQMNWILLVSLLNEERKAISIKVAGTQQFCESINNRIKNNPSKNNV